MANFDQRKQKVQGPQYNAENIYIHTPSSQASHTRRKPADPFVFLPGFLILGIGAFLCYGGSIYNHDPSELFVAVGFAIIALSLLVAFIITIRNNIRNN